MKCLLLLHKHECILYSIIGLSLLFISLGTHVALWISSLIHQRRQWHPTPVFLPGKSHGWRSLVGYSPWDCWESDMTERLHFHFSLLCIGEGNGNPLQCPCLENPRDRGAWWAAVHGVAQSQTRLKRLSSSSSSSLLHLTAWSSITFYLVTPRAMDTLWPSITLYNNVVVNNYFHVLFSNVWKLLWNVYLGKKLLAHKVSN